MGRRIDVGELSIETFVEGGDAASALRQIAN